MITFASLLRYNPLLKRNAVPSTREASPHKPLSACVSAVCARRVPDVFLQREWDPETQN